jgi:hypothetical protein
MALIDEVEARAKEIKTDGYSMSIGEVLSMWRDGDLDVHPEFQRIFRWSDEQKSRLVESILLGIPIPTIFVSQRDDGVWDVIDGVQRLSTILQFVGMYIDDDGQAVGPVPLLGTEYLPSLDGYRWEGSGSKVFSEAQRRDFKRAKLDFRIVKKESDEDAKYDLFQRLNSGTELSPQEARNCLLVMLNRDFYHWVVDLGEDDAFNGTVALSSRKEDEGFRQELVLRFHLQHDFSGGTQELPHELGEYLTTWMRRISTDPTFDLTKHEVTFRRSFALLAKALEDNCFRRYDPERDRFLGGFSISAYEAITSGVSAAINVWETRGPDDLAARIREMWAESRFKENSGSGISPRRRMPRLVHFGRAYFA